MAVRGRPKGSGRATSEAEGAVKALDRALRLCGVVAEADGLTLTAIAERLDLPVSTVHRLLTTLSAHGWVESDEVDRTWAIGVEAFRVGQAFSRRVTPLAAARPVMRDLMEATGETANLGIFEGGDAVFVAQVESREPIRAFFRAGERRAAHASGIGKALLAARPAQAVERWLRGRRLDGFTERTITTATALLADLAATRERGYSIDDEERSLGMRCLGAAVFDENGEAVAALSISGPSQRIGREDIERLGPLVRAAADRVTEAVGGRRPRSNP